MIVTLTVGFRLVEPGYSHVQLIKRKPNWSYGSL